MRDHPWQGRPVPTLAPDLRQVAFRNYLILYRVDDEAVLIVRVLHGSRDIRKLIGDAGE
ncbi:MAG TPA: type II toxin-antitoxin system RelE/ParE family toxin [Beijerinckiaceae bacterium]|jgi:plasmid stabilization system protein ParE